MITLLEQMNFWHWIAFGLVLLLLELLGTAGYLLWLGLSALLVGAILSAIPMSWSLQWLTFAVFSLFFLPGYGGGINTRRIVLRIKAGHSTNEQSR